jgi:hypothetical protein
MVLYDQSPTHLHLIGFLFQKQKELLEVPFIEENYYKENTHADGPRCGTVSEQKRSVRRVWLEILGALLIGRVGRVDLP